MTPAGFRRIALGLESAAEHAHHAHPDFRVGGRIFATLGYPDRFHGMVSLTPEQQRARVREHPQAFTPVKGKWGEQGATLVRLASVEEETLGDAVTLAWQNVRTKGATGATGAKGARSAKSAGAKRATGVKRVTRSR